MDIEYIKECVRYSADSSVTSELLEIIDDYESLKAEVARLHLITVDQDRILRSSVPEHHKGCASPVGAVQNYISELETEIERLHQVAEITNDTMRRMVEEANAQTVMSYTDENGDLFLTGRSIPKNTELYAHPIPAQQSVDRDTIINVLLSIGNMSEGIIADAIISAIGAQQSPAVGAPDAYVPIHTRSGQPLWANAVTNLEQDHPSSYEMRPVYFNPSPRITEQDAPITLTEDQVAVLGRPNFACSSIARVLVHKGAYAEIPPRSENEQAVAIHFLNSMLEKHGSNWRLESEKVLNKLNAKPESVGG